MTSNSADKGRKRRLWQTFVAPWSSHSSCQGGTRQGYDARQLSYSAVTWGATWLWWTRSAGIVASRSSSLFKYQRIRAACSAKWWKQRAEQLAAPRPISWPSNFEIDPVRLFLLRRCTRHGRVLLLSAFEVEVGPIWPHSGCARCARLGGARPRADQSVPRASQNGTRRPERPGAPSHSRPRKIGSSLEDMNRTLCGRDNHRAG